MSDTLPPPAAAFVEEQRLKSYRITLPKRDGFTPDTEENAEFRRGVSSVVVATSEIDAWAQFCDMIERHPSRKTVGATVEQIA
jgi:hypothetical protein